MIWEGVIILQLMGHLNYIILGAQHMMTPLSSHNIMPVFVRSVVRVACRDARILSGPMHG